MIDKLIRSWSVLSVVAILDQQDSFLLKLNDGRCARLTRHIPAPLDW
jgi:hypothetical protein